MRQNVQVRALLIGLTVTVVALVGGAVGADFGTAICAEYRLARTLRAEAGLRFDPWVGILGFPFIPQAVRHRYDEVEIKASGVERPIVGKAGLEATMHQVDLTQASWLVRPGAMLPVGKLESRIIIDSTHLGRFMGINDLMVEAPPKETNDATGGTTESGISSSVGLVFTGTPKAAGLQRTGQRLGGPVHDGPRRHHAGVHRHRHPHRRRHRRPAGSRRQARRGAGGVQQSTARAEAAVRHRPRLGGRPRIRCHHRRHRGGTNPAPGRVHGVMSSSLVFVVCVITAALGVAMVIGLLINRRSGVLRDSPDAVEHVADLGLSRTGPTIVHFSAVWCGPCAAVRRVVDQVCNDLPDVAHVEIDMDANPAAARRLSVLSLPTTFIFDADGRQRYRSAAYSRPLSCGRQLAPLLA